MLFFFFLIISLYFLIPVVNIQIFNPTAELAIQIRIPTKETKAEIETHIVFPQCNLKRCILFCFLLIKPF